MSGRLLLGTRKGLLVLRKSSAGWRVERETLLGVPVAYGVVDPRDGTMWAAEDHGHWGAKLSRSRDGGETWEKVEPPKYPEGATTQRGYPPVNEPAKLELVWTIAFGSDKQPGRVWFGTNPGGLFRSDDGGDTSGLVAGLWDHESRPKWMGGGRDTPGIHSISVDPRDDRVLRVAVSCGGVFESTDDGATWRGRNRGLRADFLPDPNADYGHDPHFVDWCPAKPDVGWMQNHCGIFRTTNGGETWTEISQENGPARFGFPVAAHETDPDVAWVVPAHSDMRRMAIGGGLVVCRTEDGGKTWNELRRGLPQEHAYDLVLRHALARQGQTLVFGSTTGNLYASDDGGDSWQAIGHHFPPIYSVRFAP